MPHKSASLVYSTGEAYAETSVQEPKYFLIKVSETTTSIIRCDFGISTTSTYFSCVKQERFVDPGTLWFRMF